MVMIFFTIKLTMNWGKKLISSSLLICSKLSISLNKSFISLDLDINSRKSVKETSFSNSWLSILNMFW